MFRRLMLASAMLSLLGLAGADDKPTKDARFEKLKTLVGEWVQVGEDGKPGKDVASVFKLTAGGTAIQETLFPGQPMEMVSVYHLDGKDIVMTHYCMLGNQPKMKADANSTEKELVFKFAGGTNLNPEKDMHMHEGSIKIIDADNIVSSWVGYQDGKPAADHAPTFKLTRKK